MYMYLYLKVGCKEVLLESYIFSSKEKDLIETEGGDKTSDLWILEEEWPCSSTEYFGKPKVEKTLTFAR